MKIALLISGGLGEVVLRHFITKYELSFVLTDSDSKNITKLCNECNIPVYAGNPRKHEIDRFIDGLNCDVIASVNYLFIIETKIMKLARHLCFNVHGSLLPKYRGRTPHVWSIINNERETGITAHVIDEGCDSGDIIRQAKISILEDDTGASILEKYSVLYVPFIEEVLLDYQKGTLTFKKQDETKATFFGKRKPEDGRIDWNWQRDRINNWVRAQSNPYPGAFTYFNKSKIIIDKIAFSDLGYTYDAENGSIVRDLNDCLYVKTPNGMVELIEIRNREHLTNVRTGDKFISLC